MSQNKRLSSSKTKAVPSGFQGVFAAGDDAAGLAQLRPGFGKTPEDDRLFALGYPRLVLLHDNPYPMPKDVKSLQKILQIPYTQEIIPRSLALRLLRQLGIGPDITVRLATWENTSDAPITEEELPELAEEAFFSFGGGLHSNILEALVGTHKLLPLLVSLLERTAAAGLWRKAPMERSSGNMLFLQGFLRRVSTQDALQARERLERVFERCAREESDGFWRPTAALDLVLHGRTALTRTGKPPTLQNLAYVLDEESWVATHALTILANAKPADRYIPDARIAFNGGPEVACAFKESGKAWKSEFKSDFAAQCARIA